MESFKLLIICIILCVYTCLDQNVLLSQTGKFEQKADSLFKVFKYDSASVYYYKAAKQYEIDENWLHCAKNYRLTSNSLLRAARYDTSLYYSNKAYHIANMRFKESNKDEMFEKSDILINLADEYEIKGKYKDELAYCNKAMTLCLKIDSVDKLKISGILDKTGVAYSNLGIYDSAYQYCDSGLNLRIKLFGEQHIDVACSYSNIGRIYLRKEEYDKAIEHFQKNLQILVSVYSENHPDIAFCYTEIGISFVSKGEFDKSLEYFQKALRMRISVYGENHPAVADCYNNIGRVYSVKGKFDESIEYVQRALRINILIFGEHHPKVAACYNNIGNVYDLKGEWAKALEYALKALPIFISISGEKNIFIAYVYNNIGRVYQNTGEFDKAIEYYQKSLQIKISILGENNPDVGIVYYNIGGTYLKKGETYHALQFYQKAIISGVIGFTDTSIYTNPRLEKILHEHLLANTLKNKANAFYQQSKTQTNPYRDLEASLSTYELAFQLFQNMRNEYNIEKTRLLLSETTKDYYIQAAHVAMEYAKLKPSWDNIGKPYEFIEKGKSAALSARFNESSAKIFAGIPNSLLETEKELRVNIGDYTTQISKLKSQKGAYDTLKVNDLANKNFNCSRKLDSLIAFYETAYPSY